MQDIGEPGQQILYPLAPFGILLFATYGMFHVLTQGVSTIGNIPDVGAAVISTGLAGFAVAYGITFYLLFVPIFVIATIATCMITSNIMGQCLLPSDPKQNPYGSNPNEVLP